MVQNNTVAVTDDKEDETTTTQAGTVTTTATDTVPTTVVGANTDVAAKPTDPIATTNPLNNTASSWQWKEQIDPNSEKAKRMERRAYYASVMKSGRLSDGVMGMYAVEEGLQGAWERNQNRDRLIEQGYDAKSIQKYIDSGNVDDLKEYQPHQYDRVNIKGDNGQYTVAIVDRKDNYRVVDYVGGGYNENLHTITRDEKNKGWLVTDGKTNKQLGFQKDVVSIEQQQVDIQAGQLQLNEEIENNNTKIELAQLKLERLKHTSSVENAEERLKLEKQVHELNKNRLKLDQQQLKFDVSEATKTADKETQAIIDSAATNATQSLTAQGVINNFEDKHYKAIASLTHAAVGQKATKLSPDLADAIAWIRQLGGKKFSSIVERAGGAQGLAIMESAMLLAGENPLITVDDKGTITAVHGMSEEKVKEAISTMQSMFQFDYEYSRYMTKNKGEKPSREIQEQWLKDLGVQLKEVDRIPSAVAAEKAAQEGTPPPATAITPTSTIVTPTPPPSDGSEGFLLDTDSQYMD